MHNRDRALPLRMAGALLAVLVTSALLAGPMTSSAKAVFPNPCDAPGIGAICDAIGGAITSGLNAAGGAVMRGVTTWVTDAAVWVTGKVGDLIDATASPDLQAGWFQSQYGSMVTIAGVLALLMLLLAVIQAIIRQDAGILIRAALGYLPAAFILAGVAIAASQLLISITDDLSAAIVQSLGSDSSNLLQAVGGAYTAALQASSGIPLFGVFLGAIILAIGAFVLWIEMIIRDAAIYICVFFLPLTFVAMIWPAASRWARRLVELLVAIILAKFVIVSILSLATGAITNTSIVQGDGHTFERMIAGSALLVLAAWSPFALLRLIPMMEVAAASVVGQRHAIGAAAGSAGIQTPAAYMRQAMDRNSGASTSPAYATTGGTTYVNDTSTTVGTSGGGSANARSGRTSAAEGGAVYPTPRNQAPAPARTPPSGASGPEPPTPSSGTTTVRPPQPPTGPRPPRPPDET